MIISMCLKDYNINDKEFFSKCMRRVARYLVENDLLDIEKTVIVELVDDCLYDFLSINELIKLIENNLTNEDSQKSCNELELTSSESSIGDSDSTKLKTESVNEDDNDEDNVKEIKLN